MGRKRFLALVMALSMLFTLMAPAFAFADGTIKVLFTDSKGWGNVNVHYWGNGESQRPGKAMTYTGITNDCGQKIYRAEIPAGVSILFNNGNGQQTVDITSGVVNNAWWYAEDDKDERGHFYVGSLQCSHPGTAAVEENRTEPTCTTPGSYDSVVYCSVCDAEISRETIVIPAPGHNLIAHEAVAATCTTAGNIAYWSCDRCGKYFADENGTNERAAEEVFIDATGIHDPVADPRVDPTCTETGLTEGSHCSSCGAILVERQVIPATGVHDWDLENPNWHTPTQDSSGIWKADVTFTCKSCNNTRTETASMVGTLSETIASCTGGGNLQATFRVVFGTGTFDKTIKWNETELDPAAHPATLEHIDAASATCVKEGTNECWYCSACNKYFSDETGSQEMAEGNRVIPINENAHNWDEGVVTTEPTCTDAGVRTYTCQNNPEHTKTESVEAPGHTLKHEDAVAATTTADGHVEGYTCSVCYKYFSDANAEHEIEAGSWVIPALAVTVVDDENGGFTASIPAGYFTSDETDHEPTVTSEAATIVFNSPAKTAIANAAGGNPVSLSVATSTNDGVMTVTIEMTANNANNAAVFENPGEDAFATVTVPFALGQGMVPVVNLVVDGERTPVEVLDYSDNSVTFRADHFSVYEVSQEEQLGSEIRIDKSYFPDEAFRNYVSDHVDGHIGDQTFEKDGYLSAEEIAAVKSINIPYGCKDVTGITIFSAVEEITFVATYSAFPKLDVSSFEHLKFLGGYMNFDLTSIVFGPKNSSTLKKLFIDNFRGDSLDLSSLSALEELRLVDCPNLTSVDVSNCTNLVQIGVGCCGKVTSLDVSHNLQLEHLSVDYGALTTLDVSCNEKLTTLACNNNQLASLNLSNNPLLERLDCSNNSLTDLNIDNNTKLWALKYAGNEFNTVSVSKETLKSLIVGTDTWFGVYPTLIAKEDTTIGPINIHTGDKVSFGEVYSTGSYDATHRNGKKLVITNSNSSTYYYVIAMGMGGNAQFSVFDDSAVQMDEANDDNWSQIDLPSLVCSATSASGGSYTINGIALGINMVEASSENMTEGPLKEAVEAANVIAFDVYPQITLKTSDGDKSVDLSHSSALQNQSFSVTLPLGKEYANQVVTITHYNDNGTVADTWTLTADEKGNVQFITRSFSIITVNVDHVAAIENVKYDSLKAAVDSADVGDTIRLLANIYLTETINIDKDVTIDLNGHNITATNARALWVKSGEVTITGTGTVSTTGCTTLDASSSVMRVGNSGAGKAKLTIGKDVTVSTEYCYGVTAFGTNADGVELVVNGTVAVTGAEAAVSGNGNSGNKGAVTINEGAVVSAANSAAVYHPQGDKLTINGGTITGPTAVYVKSGTVDITGGTLTGNGAAADYTYNGNGCNATGDALVVDNCNYPGGAPTVTISGGTFESSNAKGIGSYAGNSMTELASVTSNNDTISIPEDEKWVAKGTNPETYDLVKKEYVAQIGETKYETLAEAFAAVRPGDTITMLKDSNESADLISLPDGAGTYTLDLNNQTVTFNGFKATGNAKRTFIITDSTVTEEDLSQYDGRPDMPGGKLHSTGLLLATGDNITIDLQKGNISCEGLVKNDIGYGAVGGEKNNTNVLHLIIENGSFIVEKGNVFRTKSGNVKIENGYIEAGFEVIRQANETTISGGILKGGATLASNSQCTKELHIELKGKTIITSGLFANNFNDNLNTFYVTGNYTAVPVEIGETTWYKVVPAVASVTHGNKTTNYATLAEAVEAAADNDTVTLLDNVKLVDEYVEIRTNITLELAGHSITRANVNSTGSCVLDIYSTVKLQDSVGNGSINGGVPVWLNNNASFTLDSGTLNGTVNAINACNSSTAIINGGAVNSTSCGIFACNDAKVTVNGGAITGASYGISTNGSATGNNESKDVEVTVKDGSVSATDHDGIAIYIPAGAFSIEGGTISGPTAIYQKSGTLSISGGTITATGAAAAYSHSGDGANPTGDALVVDNCNYPGGAPTATISGTPTITSTYGKGIGSYYGNNVTELATVTATSNTITIPDDEKWVAKGTDPETYDLVKREYVAQIGDVKYETLESAITAAGSNDTITLLADVTGEFEVAAGKAVVLNLNGKTITSVGDTLTVRGTLTVNDSSKTEQTAGTGKIIGKWPVNVVGGTLVFNEGIVEAQEMAGWFSTGSTVTINGGTFSSADNTVLGTPGNEGKGGNTITVNGGTFNGNISAAGYIACGIYAANNDTWTISGGTFNINGGAGIVVRAGTVSLNGGSFTTSGNTTGKVGDAGNAVPCSAVVLDVKAGYPGAAGTDQITIGNATLTTASGVDAIAVLEDANHSYVDGSIKATSNALTVPADYKWVEGDTAGTYKLVEAVVVTFYLNGGQIVIDNETVTGSFTQTVANGATAIEPNPAPTNGNQNFAGWFSDEQLNSSYNFDDPVTTDMTLYAKWDVNVTCSVSKSIELNDSIRINVKLYNLSDAEHPEYYHVSAAFNGSTTVNGNLADLLASGVAVIRNEKYVIPVADTISYQITDLVHVVVSYGADENNLTVIDEFDYSVQMYCENMIRNNPSNAKLVAVCTATLDYGAYSQKQFNYKIGNLANANYTAGADTVSATVVPNSFNITNVTGSCTGITATAKSINLLSATEIRFKFTPADINTLSSYSFTVNGQPATAKVDSGKFMVTVQGVKAPELDTAYTVVITNNDDSTSISVTYSVIAYAYNMYTSSNENVANMCKALYRYFDAAKSFFG